MSKNRNLLVAFALVASSVAGSELKAAIVISNLPAPDQSAVNLVPGSQESFAMGFTIGSTAYALESVALRLFVFNPAQTEIELMLMSNSLQDNPDQTLVDFQIPSLQSGLTTLELFPTSPFTLEAATTYWLTLRNTAATPNTTQIQWILSDEPTGTGASHLGSRYQSGGFPPTGIDNKKHGVHAKRNGCSRTRNLGDLAGFGICWRRLHQEKTRLTG